MAELVKGDVVVLAFPYSDLSNSKKRPALVLSTPSKSDDVILCQITSKSFDDNQAIQITSKDFVSGNLPVSSYIRSDKLFTAHSSIIISIAGQVSPSKYDSVVNQIMQQISR